MKSEPLLKVDRIHVDYHTPTGTLGVLRDVSLEIEPGQIVGVVGESGSGKSTLALAIMRYLPHSGYIRQGSIRFMGRDLINVDQEDMRHTWGVALGFVPQDPLSALNPSIRVGEQIAEVLRRHKGLDRQEAFAHSLDWIEQVKIPEPERTAQSFPHQLSGGMQQRLMIAMALCTEPALLLLDEPTTNLDATSQAIILDLLLELMEAQKTAAIYISHNLGVVARICDELAVLYAGEVVERGPTGELFNHPHHPYTRGLLDSVPRLGNNRRNVHIQAIAGQIPSLEELPRGCIFRERCPLAIAICDDTTPLYMTPGGRESRCHRWQEIASREVDPGQNAAPHTTINAVGSELVAGLDVQGLRVTFKRSGGLLERIQKKADGTIQAVDGLSLQIQPGETLGLVGESGSGKTTAARAILGLLIPDDGKVLLGGQRLAPELEKRSKQVRRRLQIVFQNPYEAFNPYLTIGQSLSRPLSRLLNMPADQVPHEVGRLLGSVKLPASFSGRLPGSLSGGERQRVALARALASSPDLLITDEAVSALDVSVQAAILNLLGEMQAESGNATLFISHDLAAVGYIADRIAVIYQGELMQVSPSETLFQPPYHPYTEALLSAIPLLDPEAQQERIRLQGDQPTVIEEVPGCSFAERCPRRIGDICYEKVPPWQEAPGGKRIYCHIPIKELDSHQAQVFRFSWEKRGRP